MWGGSSPSTSFDCSGFVCWVYTASGVHNLPRTTATGIFNQCAYVSPADARPGDLIFLTKTYNCDGPVSHVGIYVGDGMMIHAGDPIKYASINTNYWQEQVDRAANTGIFLFGCTYVLFALIGAFLSRPFFLAQTHDAEIVGYGVDYASICLIFSFGIFAQFCFERLLQSTGRTKLSMMTQLIGAVINIVLDPILIFGWFGLPRLEVKGAAIATVAGQIIAAIIGLFVNLKKNPEIHIRAKLVRWHGATAGEIYRVGVPSIIMGSIGSVMTFGMNKILIAFTTTATAVFGAYFKLQSFIFMPVFGLNNAMVPILSYNYGARKPERVKKTVKLSIFTAIGIMILGFAAFELIPDVLLELFDASETMLSIGTTALRIIGTHFLIAGINVVAMSVYQAVGDPLYSLLSAVTRQLVVLLPAAWLLARTGRLELVWLAFPIAELAALAMSTIFLRKTLRTAECRMADDDYGEVV